MRRVWTQYFESFAAPRMGIVLLLGFFSGLPLALTASTLTAWLFDAQIERATIGLFAAVATPYAFKFLWSPLMDGLKLPILHKRLGRRRSWLLLIQLFLVGALLMMGSTNPAFAPALTAFMAVIVATCSASQDIVIDAYRVESLYPHEQGTGAAMATFGYRIGLLVAGAGSLWLADTLGWQSTYALMALIMSFGLLLTLVIKEPQTLEEEQTMHASDRRTLRQFIKEYVLAPMRDMATRPYWAAILIFIILYKLGDAFMGVMFNPFLLDIGFSKTEIAAVVKVYGLIATLLGAFAGGAVVARFGMYRALLMCGFLHMLTNLLMVVQAKLGAHLPFLAVSISLENFTGGMGTAAFIAYLSALCRVNYTATQYALLSSLAAFGRTWLSTPSGFVADALGWQSFFVTSTLLGLPSLLLLCWLHKRVKWQ